MDLLGFTLLYMGLVGACLFAMLFGELRIFRGTPIAKLQWFITGGFCDYLWWAVEGTCGKSGKRSLAKVEDVCCNRPNPVLQVLYVALLLAAYYLYSRDIFSLLPLPYAPSWHRYTGTAAVGACLLSFYTTSVSDPGAVDADNLGAHLAIYDYDDVTSFQKDCWTCMQQRPARSKHCPVCNRCIARFDHHCAWVNNCIGLFNLRWFLAFLLANILLCTYAVVLACTVFYGEMHRHHVWNLVMLDYNTGSLIALKDSPRRIAQWLVTHYTVAVTLTAFLAIAALLVGSFLGYHMHLVPTGTEGTQAHHITNLVAFLSLTL
ncbi:hypothetical protein WJX72_003324 [[Myrmecia] bisecta]|uniref:S-acyltransferase n=1 Tax=[Myrmecia] bisecta TaxID=41462 RepID=A0AAW1QEL9_9CHLO